jgi:hypothetical protein
MHRSAFVAAAALVLVSLAGCSAATEAPAPKPKTTAVAEPKVDPGPVTLTKEEAGARYLDIVCAPNAGVAALNAAYDVGEPDFLAGGAPDPAAVKATGAALMELDRLAIEQLDDTYYVWPEKVAAQLPHIRSSYMGELASNQSIANAATFQDAYYATVTPQTPEQLAAGQEIRYQLEIPADTVASCVGHEDGLARLAADKIELDEALAEQD